MSETIKIWNVKRPYDPSKKVKVYYNLRDKVWSVLQNGKVVLHASNLYLRDVTFEVNQRIRERVIAKRQKEVHAFVVGYIINSQEIREGTNHLSDDDLAYCGVYYNPYTCETFVEKETSLPVIQADFCDMDVFADPDSDKVLAIWKKELPKEV